jgi:hypothetical protein
VSASSTSITTRSHVSLGFLTFCATSSSTSTALVNGGKVHLILRRCFVVLDLYLHALGFAVW